tara:strand:- start:14146 stop:14385 length:240 start_codon:yes stop_codon:yes gene_type:complete
VLTFVIFGWAGALVLVIGKSSREQGNTYVINPIAHWINIELFNPARCFKSEVIKPLISDLKVAAKEWNQSVGSKPELSL